MQIAQNSATVIVFFMADANDSKTALTGLSPTIVISKAGGAFATASGSVTEMARGFYKFTTTTAETDTLGAWAYEGTATGADVWRDIHQVV